MRSTNEDSCPPTGRFSYLGRVDFQALGFSFNRGHLSVSQIRLFSALDGAPNPPALRLPLRERSRLAAALLRLQRHQGEPEARRHLVAFLCDWLPPPRQATGPSWLTWLRIARAAQLLASGERGVLALALGFASPSWFHRAFRAARGLTPAAYRQRHAA